MRQPLLDTIDPLFSPFSTDWQERPTTADEVAARIDLAFFRSQLFLADVLAASVVSTSEGEA